MVELKFVECFQQAPEPGRQPCRMEQQNHQTKALPVDRDAVAPFFVQTWHSQSGAGCPVGRSEAALEVEGARGFLQVGVLRALVLSPAPC